MKNLFLFIVLMASLAFSPTSLDAQCPTNKLHLFGDTLYLTYYNGSAPNAGMVDSIEIDTGNAPVITFALNQVVTDNDTLKIDVSGTGLTDTTTYVAIRYYFGGTTVGSDCILAGTLPVDFVSFESHVHMPMVQLRWRTASEINSSHFEVERRYRHQNTWESIKHVFSQAHNGMSQHVLTYNVSVPIQHTAWYRIKQTDFNHKTHYSEIIFVPVPTQHNPTIQLGPNPTLGSEIVMTQTGADMHEGTVTLLDMHGQKVSEYKVHNPTTRISVVDVPVGIYTFVFRDLQQNTLLRRRVILH